MAGKRKVARAVWRRVGAAHVWLFRRTRGRRGGRVQGVPVLLITTRGRVTQRLRTQPIGYLRDRDRLVVCGSNGGSPHAPMWPSNLQADPHAQVDLGTETFDVVATEAVGDDYDRRWRQLVDVYPAFEKYARKTERRIPVWVLEPVAPASAAGALERAAEL